VQGITLCYIEDLNQNYRVKCKVMSKHKIETTGPIPCPECGEGLMLAFARPHFKPGEKTDKQFSHYENYYKCSRCRYEIRGRNENTDTMKEGGREPDQDEGDNEEDENDDADERKDEVDSWQRRRDLK